MKKYVSLLMLSLSLAVSSVAMFCSCGGYGGWMPGIGSYSVTYYCWVNNGSDCSSGSYFSNTGWVEVRNSFGEIIYDGNIGATSIVCTGT